MKVLEKGSFWKKQITCKGCSARLEIEGEDIEYEVTEEDTVVQQYKQEIEGRYFVTCPECTLNIVLKSKDIPENIKRRLKE